MQQAKLNMPGKPNQTLVEVFPEEAAAKPVARVKLT
jgi:hypothetical protein